MAEQMSDESTIYTKRPVNAACWALCSKQGKRWRVRRVVWGRLLARAEKRSGEVIKRATILVREDK